MGMRLTGGETSAPVNLALAPRIGDVKRGRIRVWGVVGKGAGSDGMPVLSEDVF